MNVSLRWLFFLPLLLGSARAQAPAKPQPPLALTHVTVIDATGLPAQPDMTLIIAKENNEVK